MKQRILAVMLAAGVLFSMTGCSNSSSDSASASSTGTDVWEGVTDSSTESSTEAVSSADQTADVSTAFEDALDAVTVSGNTLTTPYFSVTVPSDWEERYEWETSYTDVDDSYRLLFYCKAAKDNDEGGFLCGIVFSTQPPEFIQYTGGDFLFGAAKEGEAETSYYVSVDYPSDVQYGESTSEEYNSLGDELDALKGSVTLAEGLEKVQMTYAESMAGVESTVEGVMVDASMHAFTLEGTNGQMLYFGGEEISTSNLADGLQPGHCYRVTYKGVLGDDGSTEDVSFVSIENTDEEAEGFGAKDYDAQYIAGQVKLAFHYKDMSYLAGVCQFPVTLDDQQIASADDLTALDFDSTMTEDLQRNVQYCSLYYADITGDTYSISLLGEAPEVVITKNADGQWLVTAIHTK